MLKEYRCDLHIHTCLSPCADPGMVPGLVIKKARARGFSAIAVSDHNSAENTRAFKKAGEREGLKVLGGMEITTREEVHILALFDRDEDLFKLQDIIYDNLPGLNDEEAFGRQIVIDEDDQPIKINDRFLIGATLLSLEEIVDTVHRLSGIAIASHIDREGFGIIDQLGFIPPGLNLDGLEISPKIALARAREDYADLDRFELITSSDAHYLDDIGKCSTSFLIEGVSVEEIRKALFKEDGRRVIG
ncbi:PHP domain-containing protein [bacterium]|nr:PHP domain-containing protein [bacterium]MBU2431984.1 PHP domain-containing protein [Pseudomonadota bacterium]